MERYMKGRARLRGNKVPQSEAAARAALAALPEADAHASYTAAWQLMRSEFFDDKVAGMTLLSDSVLTPAASSPPPRSPSPLSAAPSASHEVICVTASLLDEVETLLDNQSFSGVNEWATCDALSSRVVARHLAAHPEHAARVLSWSHAPIATSSVWKRRAGHVSFLRHIRLPASGRRSGWPSVVGDDLFGEGFYLDLISACEAALDCSDRFAQLGAGWVLRYLLVLPDRADVRTATKETLVRCAPKMSKEGMRYALEHCDDEQLRAKLLAKVPRAVSRRRRL
ncbi:MAG: hypothetical protein SGPRY_007239, partial [Prymnesium sp.]